MFIKSIQFVTGVILAVSVSAFAADEGVASAVTVPSNVVQGSIEAPRESIRKRLYADFLTTYHGPMLHRFGSYSFNARGKEDPKALAGFDNELSTAYMIDMANGVGLGPNVPFQFQPTLSERQWVIGDVGVKAFTRNLIKTDNLMVYASGYLQAPTSEDARRDNMAVAIRSTPFFIYDIAQTRWRVGSWSDFRYRAGVTTNTMMKVWVGPYVSYKLSDKVALNLMYETEAQHNVGDAGVKFKKVLGDFQPGVVWQITPSAKLNPYLVIVPDNKLSTRTTGIGAVFAAQLL